MIIRQMEAKDVEAVYQLSCESFSEPWSRASIEKEISNTVASYYVAEDIGGVVGFAGLWHVLDEGEIINIAVSKVCQRQGIGNQLLQHLLVEARAKVLRVIHLEVRASNQRAKALYIQHGFKEIARRKAYYHHPTEDACIMKWQEKEA